MGVAKLLFHTYGPLKLEAQNRCSPSAEALVEDLISFFNAELSWPVMGTSTQVTYRLAEPGQTMCGKCFLDKA